MFNTMNLVGVLDALLIPKWPHPCMHHVMDTYFTPDECNQTTLASRFLSGLELYV